jgi:hypothetical protein
MLHDLRRTSVRDKRMTRKATRRVGHATGAALLLTRDLDSAYHLMPSLHCGRPRISLHCGIGGRAQSDERVTTERAKTDQQTPMSGCRAVVDPPQATHCPMSSLRRGMASGAAAGRALVVVRQWV